MSRRYWLAVFALVLGLGLSGHQASAQNFVTNCAPISGGGCYPVLSNSITWTGPTVGTTHAQVLAANSARIYMLLHNPSQAGGNTAWCSFGGTAVVGAAGTISIAPGQYIVFEGNDVPRQTLDCIASGASTPMTIGVN